VYYIYKHGLVGAWDWPLAVVCMIVSMFTIFYVIEQIWLGSDNPKYPFDQAELERFRIPEKLAAARQYRQQKKLA
jgi:hypothetical protein